MPVSVLMSRKLMNRMVNNNKRSAALNAEMSGFNQESLSNIQTIKAFDLIKLYCERLKDLQTKYLKMRLEFNRMSAVTSFIMAIVGMAVSYSCYGWGIYRVWSGAISYGTMTLFLSPFRSAYRNFKLTYLTCSYSNQSYYLCRPSHGHS